MEDTSLQYEQIAPGVYLVCLEILTNKWKFPIGFLGEYDQTGFTFGTTPRIAALLPKLEFQKPKVSREDAISRPELHVYTQMQFNTRETAKEYLEEAVQDFMHLEWREIGPVIKEYYEDMQRVQMISDDLEAIIRDRQD